MPRDGDKGNCTKASQRRHEREWSGSKNAKDDVVTIYCICEYSFGLALTTIAQRHSIGLRKQK